MTAHRSSRHRLQDILDAVEKIESRTRAGSEAFLRDEMVQVWVVHHLEIIGEAAAHVSAGIRAHSHEIDWIAITAARNRVVHGYFDVDLNVVWETVERDIPVLKAHVTRILESLPED